MTLRVGDFDLAGRRARISRTWSNDETGRAVLGTPKNSKARTIAVPGSLVDGLAGLCDGHGDSDYVFPGRARWAGEPEQLAQPRLVSDREGTGHGGRVYVIK